jgi:hypothetical protein
MYRNSLGAGVTNLRSIFRLRSWLRVCLVWGEETIEARLDRRSPVQVSDLLV